MNLYAEPYANQPYGLLERRRSPVGPFQEAAREDAGVWVHIWFAVFDSANEIASSAMSPDDILRMNQIPTPEHRSVFGQSRAALRKCLSSYLGLLPQCIPIHRGISGKPTLSLHPGLHFNLSHTKCAVVIAVSNAEVGIDMEDRSLLNPLDRIPLLVSETERAALVDLPKRELNRSFMRLWTRKEAILKAWGCGLAGLSALSEVSPDPDDQDFLFDSAGCSWLRRDLTLPLGFYGAISVKAKSTQNIRITIHES